MTQEKPPTETAASSEVVDHDPYAIRSIEQLFALFDGGEFMKDILSGHKDLQVAMVDHKDEHGTKGCKGSMTITVNYALGKQGDLDMGATVNFTHPKAPPSSAAAFVDDKGNLTLYSPLMAKMRPGLRDVTPHDPLTGEVRDI